MKVLLQTNKMRKLPRMEIYKWLTIILMVCIALLGYNENLHKFSLLSKFAKSSNEMYGQKESPQGKLLCQSTTESVFESDIFYSGGQYSVLTVPPVKTIDFENTSSTSLLSMSEKYEILLFDSIDSTSSVEFKRIYQSAFRFCNQRHSRTVVTEHGYPTIASTAIATIRIHILNFPAMRSDEEYSLQITSNAITIEAMTFRGALHGLSTLDQLLHSPVPMQLPVEITDYPENAWRGLTSYTSFISVYCYFNDSIKV